MKKNVPLISVVMPVYNAQKYIRDAIESILCQSFKQFEFIIVMDKSTDKTKAIIKSYASKDARIRMVINESHNIATMLNYGIGLAKTNIIARMDADDISMPNRLELQYGLLTKSDNVAVVGANIIIMDTDGNEVAIRKYPVLSREIKDSLFKYSGFAHPLTMFKKQMFDEVGGYNPIFSPTEDLDLWFRLGARYEFQSIPKLLLKYRVYDLSSSHKRLKNVELLVFSIRLNSVLKRGFQPTLFDLLYNVIQYTTLWITPMKYRIRIYNFLRNNNII